MKPPRGAVRITSKPVVLSDGRDAHRHTATCGACSWSYSNVVKSDVQWHKSNHQCPDKAGAT